MDIYLEVGKKRTVAGAIEWPGWCRSGRSEEEAVDTLLAYATRYAEAVPVFQMPGRIAIVERLDGSSGTDMGIPGEIPSADTEPVDEAELWRFRALLQACWDFLDAAAKGAQGKELRKGPRGGGRSLDAIVKHVTESEQGYLTTLGWERERNRAMIPEALAAAAAGELPTVGPRGGKRWPPRYFVRRVAWHVLDHAWEMQDRRDPAG